MSGAADKVFNPQTLSAGADGDAIVAGSNPGVEDGDVRRELHVDAVCVGAGTGGSDPYPLHFHVLAAVDDDVVQLTV